MYSETLKKLATFVLDQFYGAIVMILIFWLVFKDLSFSFSFMRSRSLYKSLAVCKTLFSDWGETLSEVKSLF